MDKEHTKLWNRDFINIMIVQFCYQLGQQMMNTLVPKYANALGGTAYIVGLVSSVFSIASTVILIVLSPAFDCYSRKRMIVLSMAGMWISFIGYAFSTSIAALFAFRVLQGMSLGVAAALTLVIASDSLPTDQMGKGIGAFALCQAVGQAIGPSFGLSMSSAIGYRYTFLIGAVPILIAFIFSFRIVNKPTVGRYQFKLDHIIEKKALPPSIIIALLAGPYCCISSFIAIYGALRGVGNIGIYFTVYAVCLLVTRPLSGTMIDKIGYDTVLIIGLVCFAISFIVISYASTLAMFLLAAVLCSLGYGIAQPTLNYMCMRCAPDRRGAASSTMNISMSIGLFSGVTVAGYLADWFTAGMGSEVGGYSMMYLVMTIPMFAALIYFLFKRKQINSCIVDS